MAKKRVHETPASVTQWCEEHYAGETTAARLRDLFEEATELAASLNIVSCDELIDVVKKSWQKSESALGEASETPGEIGDVNIATIWLAAALKINNQTALDDKMKINRAKTVTQSQARVAKKEKIFHPK